MKFDLIDGGFEASEGFGSVGWLVEVLASCCDGSEALASCETLWHVQLRTVCGAAWCLCTVHFSAQGQSSGVVEEEIRVSGKHRDICWIGKGAE